MSGRRVLDVGCGLGQGDELVRYGAAKRYFGLDFSQGLIKAAHKDHPEHVFCVGDGRFMPFCDKAVDAVTTSFTLHHIDLAARQAVIKEMIRVAGKHVIVRDLFGFERGIRSTLYRLYYSVVDGSYYRFTLPEWRTFFDECGAHIEAEIHSDEKHLTHRLCCFVLARKTGENLSGQLDM